MTNEERDHVPPLFWQNGPKEGVGENSGAQFPVHPHPHDFPSENSRSEIFSSIGQLETWIDFGWAHWRCRIGKINLKRGAKLACAEMCGNFF